jgi:uncharacterized membrane protein
MTTRAREAARWILTAIYAVLWIGGVVTQCAGSGRAAPPWAAPAFLLVAASIAALGARDVAVIALFASGGFAAEWIGVHTGWPFGRYLYTGALGPAVGGVPPVIACAWIILLLFARDLAWRTTDRRRWAVLTGALIMTASDLLIDPVATRVLDYWHWQQLGGFFGVPLVNYAGWMIVSVLLLGAAPRPASPAPAVAWLGISVLSFFACVASCAFVW